MKITLPMHNDKIESYFMFKNVVFNLKEKEINLVIKCDLNVLYIAVIYKYLIKKGYKVTVITNENNKTLLKHFKLDKHIKLI